MLPYAVCLSVSLALSLSWVLRMFPPMWYYLVTVQGVSSIVLTAMTVQYLGAPPRRPYIDALRYPRLGSRVRHLPEISPANAKGNLLQLERAISGVMRKARQYLAVPFRSAKRRLKK